MNEENKEEQNTSSVNNDINVDNSSESKPSFSDSIKNIGGALKDSKGYRSRKRILIMMKMEVIIVIMNLLIFLEILMPRLVLIE